MIKLDCMHCEHLGRCTQEDRLYRFTTTESVYSKDNAMLALGRICPLTLPASIEDRFAWESNSFYFHEFLESYRNS